MGTLRVALAVAGKELRSGLRDRQAMIYAILLPLALYPVLFWVMLQGALYLEGKRERTEVQASLEGARDAAESTAVERALTDPPADLSPGPIRVLSEVAPDVDALRDGDVDAIVALEPGELPESLRAFAPEPATGSLLFFDGSKSRSKLARSRGEDRLARLARDARVDAVGGDPTALQAFSLERRSLASEVQESAFVLSFLLPMMFCIMTVLGAFFPAVDLSAGEKERGTAETTLLLPVPRFAVLLGKVLTVSLFALIATTLNITGLLVAAEHLLSGVGAGLSFEVPWSAFPKAAPLLLLFLLSTSAILYAIASFADTFKQGQSLLGPVQLLVIGPAIIVAMPGIELTPTLALVPVAQTVLAFKAILQGDAVAFELALVAVSEVVYAAIFVFLAHKLSTAESRRLGGTKKKKKRRGLFGLARGGQA